MSDIISKEEIEEFMKINGEVKGIAMIENLNFISDKKGKEGIDRTEEEMAKIGYPIKYKEIKTMAYYPLWMDAILLTVIKRIFNYSEEDIKEMGRFEPKTSFLTKLYLKKFMSSPERLTKEVPRLWRRVFTVGNLSVGDYNKDKQYITLRLENYRTTPIQCQTLFGYFSSLTEMIMGGKISCKEIKCVFNGDEYHEFLLGWK